MNSTTKLSPVTKEHLKELSTRLAGVLSEDDLSFFDEYVKPYDNFGSAHLDAVFLIAEVTIEGNGTVKSLSPDCVVDQENWYDYEDEPDIAIDAVYIPLKSVLLPQLPFEVSGTKTFLTVLQAEGNIWDSCKDLPEWIWNDRKFEFMVSFNVITEDGNEHHGNSDATLIAW